MLGGEITENYIDGTENIVPMNSSMYVAGFDTETYGEKEIQIRYQGLTVFFLINVVAAEADYSKVDAVIAQAASLNSEMYRDFSGVTNAVAAVERGLDSTKQSEVDAMAEALSSVERGLDITRQPQVDEMAKAIYDAIDNLKIVDTDGGDDFGTDTNKGETDSLKPNGSVQTGDCSPILATMVIMLISLGIVGKNVFKKR